MDENLAACVERRVKRVLEFTPRARAPALNLKWTVPMKIAAIVMKVQSTKCTLLVEVKH